MDYTVLASQREISLSKLSREEEDKVKVMVSLRISVGVKDDNVAYSITAMDTECMRDLTSARTTLEYMPTDH